MSYRISDIDKGRLLALKERGSSNKQSAREIGRDVRDCETVVEKI